MNTFEKKERNIKTIKCWWHNNMLFMRKEIYRVGQETIKSWWNNHTLNK